MQTQTQPNTYKAKWLLNGKYSLVDDKGEIIPLLIGNDLVTAFDWLHIYPDGKIKAEYEGKDYLFNADLTPIALEIEGEPRVAFDYFGIDENGIIEVRYDRRQYFFNPDGTRKRSISITLPQGISITLTEEKKRLWDFMLASAQMKLKKSLTPEEFLSLLMESYQKTTLDDVDEKPEKAFFTNAKTARKIMQQVIDGGDQAFEKVARDALSAGKESKPYQSTNTTQESPPRPLGIEALGIEELRAIAKELKQHTYCSSVFREHDNPLDTLGLYTCGLRTCLICKIKRKQRTEVFLGRVAEHTEMIERIRKKREEYTVNPMPIATFKPMPSRSTITFILPPPENCTLNSAPAIEVVFYL